ncbi:MAG: shikimate kinase [Eubacteriaceae bacterium]|nr:shikimate kinase [Eubacteriaceae bacterium]
MNIYVTGPIGSDRKKAAQKLAEETGYDFLDFDAEIEKRDGRTIRRICMMMGEHEYRNKEYELLNELAESGRSDKEGYVCSCSDGILFDPMCSELMKKGRILIADADMSVDDLWEQAKNDTDLPYAFMSDPNENTKKKKFMELYELRKNIYMKFTEVIE